MNFARSVWTVWLRYFAVYRKNLWYGLITTFVEPVLYLMSFGFGLGGVIGEIDAGGGRFVPYRAFVLAGLFGQTLLFQAFFDAAYGGFVRMYYQKVFQAIAVTPVTLSEVLWGELLWCATRATLSASVVVAIGIAIGDFHLAGALVLVPFAFLVGLLFGALGMLIAGWARTIESISYPQYLLIFPMFLFCGVYFPLSNLPEGVRVVASILPLTSVLSIARALALGLESTIWSLPLVLLWTAILVPAARRSMKRRLLA